MNLIRVIPDTAVEYELSMNRGSNVALGDLVASLHWYEQAFVCNIENMASYDLFLNDRNFPGIKAINQSHSPSLPNTSGNTSIGVTFQGNSKLTGNNSQISKSTDTLLY